MEKKEFVVDVSMSGRLSFIVNANSEEEARKMIFEKVGAFEFTGLPEEIELESVEWDLISKAPTGNVATPFIDDVCIEEIE